MVRTAEVTFYGGPLDGVTKQVELYPHIAAPYQTDEDHFRIAYYQLQKWSSPRGAEWRYVNEDAEVR